MQEYYPKSRIVQNQYTNGGEFVLTETKEDYIGSYWITFEEEYFTGINQYDLNVRPLTLKKNPPITLVSSSLNDEYRRITANTTSPEVAALNATQVPELFFPTPAPADYQVGSFIRYFTKKRNGGAESIIEISKTTYEDITNQSSSYNFYLWETITIYWAISGPLFDVKDPNTGITTPGIVNTNARILDKANKEFRGIRAYLQDLAQYAIPTDFLVN
jgi:hypothetical protein